MLLALHSRAYQEFLTLLTEFKKFLTKAQKKVNNSQVQYEFQQLEQWFAENIVSLDQQDEGLAIAPRWQSIQREIKREFKLLSTDILFLVSARQTNTRTKRLASIGDRLSKLIDYTQLMLKSEDIKEFGDDE